MKKAKLILFSLILCFSMLFVSACGAEEKPTLAESITLTQTSVELTLGDFATIGVAILPQEATSKDFEVKELTQGIVSIDYDKQNMQFTINAPNTIENGFDTVELEVKATDGSNVNAHLTVTLKQRVTLIDTPTDLHYNGHELEWLPVLGAKGYKLNINGVDLPLVYSNTYSLDASYIGQDITARVYAVAEDDSISSGFAEYTFKILAAPKNLQYYDGTISWDAVDGAASYNIYFDGKVSNTTYTQSYIFDKFSEPKTYDIKVMAVGDDENNIEDSEYCDLIQVTKLDIPQNIRIANGVIAWDVVPNISSYKIYLDNEEPFNTGLTQFVVPSNLTAGQHTFKIASCGDEVNYISSVVSPELSFEKLEPVNSLYIKNGSVYWSANLQATSYMLYVDGVPYQTANLEVTSVDFESFNSGTYSLNVRAIGNGGNILDSDLMAQSLEATKLATPNNLHIQNIDGKNYVVWDGVQNASAYTIIINNDEPVIVDEEKYLLDVQAGTYSIIVKALGDSTQFINSNFSNMFTTTKLNTVGGLTAANGEIVWSSVLGAGKYQVLINNEVVVETVNTKFDLQSTQEQLFNAGIYTISVKAIADNANNISGDYCNNISVTKLPIPQIAVRYGALVDAVVENSSRIEYQVDIYTIAGQLVNSIIKDTLKDLSSTSYQQYKITAKAYAGTAQFGEVMYINSDVSQEFMCVQLPQVNDVDMVNGVSYFAQNSYADIVEGFKFTMTVVNNENADVLTNTQTIELNSTQREFDFTAFEAGAYSYNFVAIPNYNQNGESLQTIPYLTSKISNDSQFRVLATPTNAKINSLADKATNLTELIQKINTITASPTGMLVWDKVENATKYSVKIDGVEKLVTTATETSLLSILADDNAEHKITIQSIGNGKNIIPSVLTQEIVCKKLNRPTNLTSDGESISWHSEYNTSVNPLSSTENLVVFVAVINGNEYITLNTENLSPLTISSELESKTYKLPKLKAGDYVTQVYIIPLNAYMSVDGSIKETAGTKYVLSELNTDELYLTSMIAPQGLQMNYKNGEQILSWTPLMYQNNEVEKYVVVQTIGEEETEYEVDANEVQWLFENYTPNNYQFSVYAKANTGAYFERNGKKYYYIDSDYSSYIETIVMQNPELFVKNGVVCWNEIEGTQKYVLTFGKANGVQETKEFNPNITSFALNQEYQAGNYTFKILAQGDGSDYITSEYCSVKTFTKLTTINNLRLENGVFKYNANDIVAASNDCYYKLVVNGKEVSNGKLTETELEGFASQEYEVFVYAFGDNNRYLTSDISGSVKCIKLATPAGMALNSGILTWQKSNNASSYQLNISGSIVNDITGVTYDGFNSLTAGDYKVNVKAIGNNTSYINSDWTANKTFTKLAEITNLRVNNGVITWDKVEGNYNDIRLKIKKSSEQNYKEIKLESNVTSYVLDNSYTTGTYDICMYNAGGTYAISSSVTEVMQAHKLSAPANIKIVTENGNQYLQFDSVLNSNGYTVKVEISTDAGEQDVTFPTMLTKIPTSSLADFGVSILNSGTYVLTVCANGKSSPDNYLNSDYSVEYTIKKPKAPALVDVKTEDGFTSSGKVTWQAVEFADAYAYTIVSDNGVNITGTTKNTFVHVTSDGNYVITVKAIKDVDGFNSEESTIELSYGLFTAGSGTQDKPYLITSAEDFNKIKYNLIAYYKLTQNISFTDRVLSVISTEKDPFVGNIDGSGFSMSGVTITAYNNVVGLIPVLGQGGCISNLTINIDISSGKIVGGIVGINYGTIDNCVVNGNINPIYNVISTELNAGGIVGINYGTINKCLNNATVNPQNNMNITYAGGIVAINNGVVTGCGNNGSVSANYAGGIAAQTTADIKYCYNNFNAVVTATTFNNGSYNNAYAGGIVGYATVSTLNGATINTCYNVGTVKAISQSNNAYPYAGGIIGYNSGFKVVNCYSTGAKLNGNITISITAHNNGRGYAGIMVGFNEKGTIMASANVSIYANSNQVDYYTSSGFTNLQTNANRFAYNNSNVDIASMLQPNYVASSTIYPTINENLAKY